MAVDGQDVVGMTDEEVAVAITGREDTPVSLTLAFEGDTGLIEGIVDAIRAFLPIAGE